MWRRRLIKWLLVLVVVGVGCYVLSVVLPVLFDEADRLRDSMKP